MSLVRYFGLGPISSESTLKNAVLLCCSFIINQIRITYCIYIVMKALFLGRLPAIFVIAEVITAIVHDIFVSTWTYTAITKSRNWTTFIRELNLDKIQNRCAAYVSTMCFVCYCILMAIEIKCAANIILENTETFYVWFNFHFSQCLNYLLVFLLQTMVTALTQAYKNFKKHFQREANKDKIYGNHWRMKCITIGRMYRGLHDLNEKFNEIFGYSSLAAMCSFFANIMCGITLFSKQYPDDVLLMHICTFFIQFAISLVSCNLLSANYIILLVFLTDFNN